MSDYVPIEKRYNVDEFLKFVEIETQKPGNESNRYELIDGIIYMMAYPSMTHHNVCKFIERAFENYFENKGCTVIYGSVALFLFDKKFFALFNPPNSELKNYLGPDVMVVCDKNVRIKNDGVHGTPDIIVEVVSKSNAGNDYIKKLNTYFTFGVKEYWIVDPIKRKIRIYDMITDPNNSIDYDYTFDHVVRSELFAKLYIDFKQFTGFVED
jgi:Uma2 family endonuclease